MLAGLAVLRGVNTIEKTNMFLVPLLLVIILFTFVWSLTRDYADVGIRFLFTPHWGKKECIIIDYIAAKDCVKRQLNVCKSTVITCVSLIL